MRQLKRLNGEDHACRIVIDQGCLSGSSLSAVLVTADSVHRLWPAVSRGRGKEGRLRGPAAPSTRRGQGLPGVKACPD